ncbi:MAG: anaerobic ribonucleoside-triphosphate reductase activating protein [Acidobacteriota bacterium]|nr:anaerobic ribonucleoside-triphosphate reductase activating protein [Acidobacteriota bacterium]
MNFGGFLACSFSDYPGHLAAVVFAQGCNFCCPFCHNADLLAPQAGPLQESDVLTTLRERRRQLEGVVVSGGEPTLQPDLPAFLIELRRMGYQIKLDTNGSRPEVLRALIAARLVDFIAMDVKAPWEKYSELAGVPLKPERLQQSVALIASSGLPHQFRTTHVTLLLSPQDMAAIRAQVPDGSDYRVQPFHPEHALSPALRK